MTDTGDAGKDPYEFIENLLMRKVYRNCVACASILRFPQNFCKFSTRPFAKSTKTHNHNRQIQKQI